MKPDICHIVENATVTFTKKGGQGVLIRNQMILTASHCIDISTEGEMALGDYYIEEINTSKGYFKVSPISLDPLSDIAILGGMDSQEFYDEFIQFEEYGRSTTPVKICRNKLEAGKGFTIFIYSHEKKWITGNAWVGDSESEFIWFRADEPVKRGTSGSGIFNENGELVGIVSRVSELDFSGSAPRPLLALPVWVCRNIYLKY